MKKATVKNPIAVIKPDTVSDIRMLKVGKCKSLSGKSELTYHIGLDKASDIQFQVHANTGSGYFSNEWVPLKSILAVLDKAPKDQPITSFVLIPLFEGKSINTPPFLFAALMEEGLVKHSEVNPRCYERMDSKAFMARMKVLIEGKAESEKVKPEGKPKKASTSKKAIAKVSPKKV